MVRIFDNVTGIRLWCRVFTAIILTTVCGCNWFGSVVDCAGQQLEIGQMVDLFKNYGLMTRIFPGDANHHEFLQTEFSHNIFQKLPLKQTQRSNFDHPQHGIWTMQVHENIPNVLKALFANFKADYVENVDRLFASALSRKNVAEFLGVNNHFFYKNYSYILVLYRKTIGARKLYDDGVDSRLQLSAKVLNAIENITVGDVPSALNFVSNFGSHFVRSYSVGEAIYQIFTLPAIRHQCLSQTKVFIEYEHVLKCANASEIWPSPIKTLGGTESLEERLNKVYVDGQKFPNIFLMRKDRNLEYELYRTLFNPIITSFVLSAVSSIIDSKSSFMQEIIDNQMRLHEMNLGLSLM